MTQTSPASPSQPTYAEVTAARAALEKQQAPLRRKFNKCKTLEDLEALLDTERKAGRVSAAPWLRWIAGGPYTKASGFFSQDLHWAAEPSSGGDLEIDEDKQRRLFALLHALLEEGVDPMLEDGSSYGGEDGVACIASLEELSYEQRKKLLLLAAHRGADVSHRTTVPVFADEDGPLVGYRVARSALDIALAQAFDVPSRRSTLLLEALAPLASARALEDAHAARLIATLDGSVSAAKLAELDEHAARAGDLTRVHPRFDRTEQGSVIHFACLPDCEAAVLEHLLDRLDVNASLPNPLTIGIGIVWGVLPQIQLEAGATPLDMADGLIAFVSAVLAASEGAKKSDIRTDDAVRILERAQHKRALLIARNAVSRKPYRRVLPASMVEIVRELERLLALLGHDPAAVQTAAESVDSHGRGSWSFLCEMAKRLADSVMTPLVAKHAPLLAHTLGASMTPDGLTPELRSFAKEDAWAAQERRSSLPKKARVGVALANCFHTEGDTEYLVVRVGKDTEIWTLASGAVERFGVTVGAFLRAQVDALASSVSQERRGEGNLNTRVISTHVTISKQPFERAAKVFAEQLGDVVPHEVDPVAWDFGAGSGYVAGNLEEWPEDPPVSCLFLVEDDHDAEEGDAEVDELTVEDEEDEDNHTGSGRLHDDPGRFLDALNLGNAIGTWNCAGEATWFPIAGGGFASFIALENEQADEDNPGPGDYVDLYLSVWPVEEGWAVALLRSDEKDVLLSMLGLEAWPSNTQSVDVSYGE